MKKTIVCIAAMLMVVFSGCKKVEDAVTAYILDGFYESTGGVVIEIDGDEATVVAFTDEDHQLNTNPGVFDIGDTYIKNIEKTGDNVYSGDIIQSETKYNYTTMRDELISFSYEPTKITLTGDHDFYLSEADGWDVSWEHVSDPGNTGGGGGTGGGGTASPYKGIWVRQLGASGDETDLAIGTIPGAAANAVWMCEYKGNVGLYKGTISGSTITFDAQYGLPTYTVKLEGGQLMLKGNISNSLFTPYAPGSWTSHCGTLGN